MFASWKIVREAKRIRDQVQSALLRPVYMARQRTYDDNKGKAVKVTKGDLPLSSKVVILLVYQPDGLSGSVSHTIKHIISEGFSPFVVLNSPLPESEILELLRESALVMERPNFGYDFGGYRDAILHLWTYTKDLECVAFLNDSVWYPVFDTCDHLRQMEALGGDLIGYSCSKTHEALKKRHLDSYFFMFKGCEFLHSAEVKAFWTTLRIANNRYFTIRNGEMKMTRHFRELGFKVNWLFSEKNLLQTLPTWTNDAVFEFADYLVSIKHKRSTQISAIRQMEPAQARDAIGALLQSGSISRNNIGNAPKALFIHSGFAAMKKSKSYNYKIQRRQAVDAGVTQRFNSIIRSEIVAAVEKDWSIRS